MPEKNRFPAVLQPVNAELYSIMPMNSGKDYKARKVEVTQPLMGAGPVGGNQGGDFVVQSVALRGRDGGATAELGGEAAYALRASEGGGSDPYVLAPIPLNPNVLRGGEALTPSPDAEGRIRLRNPSFGVGEPGDPADTLQAAGPGMVAVCVTGEITHTLKADGFDASEDGTGSAANRPGLGVDIDVAATVKAKGPGAVAHHMAVRRLMPIECHRLQGFPDNWCAVPTGPKGDRIAADGPQYKQLGNSWAVNHARWVGWRTASWLAANPPQPVIEMRFDPELFLWAMVD